MGYFPGADKLISGIGLGTSEGGIVQRQRDYTIRDAMGISQKYENPNVRGYSYQGGGPSLDEYKESASNIRGYMGETRNPLIKGSDLDFGAPAEPIKGTAGISVKGGANAPAPPVSYTPNDQGYSRILMNQIADAEARTLASYRLKNPDSATLDIYSIGAESAPATGLEGTKKSKLGAPSRGLTIGQTPREGIGEKTLLGE